MSVSKKTMVADIHAAARRDILESRVSFQGSGPLGHVESRGLIFRREISRKATLPSPLPSANGSNDNVTIQY